MDCGAGVSEELIQGKLLFYRDASCGKGLFCLLFRS